MPLAYAIPIAALGFVVLGLGWTRFNYGPPDWRAARGLLFALAGALLFAYGMDAVLGISR